MKIWNKGLVFIIIYKEMVDIHKVKYKKLKN